MQNKDDNNSLLLELKSKMKKLERKIKPIQIGLVTLCKRGEKINDPVISLEAASLGTRITTIKIQLDLAQAVVDRVTQEFNGLKRTPSERLQDASLEVANYFMDSEALNSAKKKLAEESAERKATDNRVRNQDNNTRLTQKLNHLEQVSHNLTALGNEIKEQNDNLKSRIETESQQSKLDVQPAAVTLAIDKTKTDPVQNTDTKIELSTSEFNTYVSRIRTDIKLLEKEASRTKITSNDPKIKEANQFLKEMHSLLDMAIASNTYTTQEELDELMQSDINELHDYMSYFLKKNQEVGDYIYERPEPFESSDATWEVDGLKAQSLMLTKSLGNLNEIIKSTVNHQKRLSDEKKIIKEDILSCKTEQNEIASQISQLKIKLIPLNEKLSKYGRIVGSKTQAETVKDLQALYIKLDEINTKTLPGLERRDKENDVRSKSTYRSRLITENDIKIVTQDISHTDFKLVQLQGERKRTDDQITQLNTQIDNDTKKLSGLTSRIEKGGFLYVVTQIFLSFIGRDDLQEKKKLEGSLQASQQKLGVISTSETERLNRAKKERDIEKQQSVVEQNRPVQKEKIVTSIQESGRVTSESHTSAHNKEITPEQLIELTEIKRKCKKTTNGNGIKIGGFRQEVADSAAERKIKESLLKYIEANEKQDKNLGTKADVDIKLDEFNSALCGYLVQKSNPRIDELIKRVHDVYQDISLSSVTDMNRAKQSDLKAQNMALDKPDAKQNLGPT